MLMLLKFRKLCLAALLLSAWPAWADSKPVAPESVSGAVTVTAEKVIALILSNPDLVVIDSRKKTEFAKGHIEGAVNLLNSDMQPAMLAKLVPDKAGAVLFYCNGASCLRSSDAVSRAMAWGYKNVYWFRGGWNEWTEKRLPVIMD